MNKNALYGAFAVVILMSFYFIYKGDLLFLITAGLSLIGFLIISKNTKAAGIFIALGAFVSIILLFLPNNSTDIAKVAEDHETPVVQEKTIATKPLENEMVVPNESVTPTEPVMPPTVEPPNVGNPTEIVPPVDTNIGESSQVASNHYDDYKTQEELIREALHKEKSKYTPTPVENPEQYIPSGWSSSLLSGTPSVNSSSQYNFRNCAELNAVYPNGVNSNDPSYKSSLDRNNDGWACER